MARAKKSRIINQPPIFTEFKPGGIAGRFAEKVVLNLDEYEALRLSDLMGMNQSEAALEMEISRPTFTRLIERSRKKVCEMIINGRMLIVEGGTVHFKKNLIKCSSCGHMFNIKMNSPVKKCPICNSLELINLAGGFGHGRCCQRNRRR